jgi:ribonucleoside-diphosphate reductase alpha chain
MKNMGRRHCDLIFICKIDDFLIKKQQYKKKQMEISNRILSDITVYMKYAKYIPELKRRETWQELVTRNMEMHIKHYPQLEKEIRENYMYVFKKQVLPSMRSMQFAGKPIEISPNRIYNCAFAPIDDWRVFSEIMFLLLGGTGVGYSVQKHHVETLPEIMKPNKERTRRWLVADSIEGWADAVKILVKSYFFGGSHIKFDFSDIRPKGARLVTSGGKAPGPQPLKECLIKLEGILDSKENGERLKPIEVHDMVCHIADAVLAGGIRRAALISLFSATDDEMIGCKSGAWWETNPQRGRSNNSAVLLRHKITKDYFMDLWKRIEASGAGEPGIYLTNDKDWGTNPCCEIALRPFQFCNLTEVNVSNVASQEDYEDRVRAASFLGTLQAGYTNFHYLRPIWQRTTEKDALIGISMTGIGSGAVLKLDMKAASKVVKEENKRVAELLDINPAARATTVKPAGTTSLTLGTSSGIHAWHNEYYVRRVRVGKNEAIYTYLKENHPELVEDEYFRPHDTAVIGIPQKAPEGSILRNESPIQLLERVKKVHLEWIKPGHRTGNNSHNVSATVSIREHEWPAVGEWMWENRDHYNGLSVLPYDGGTYIQAPFEDCTKEKYDELMETLHDVDLSNIVEMDDDTDLSGEVACAGGACEVTLV